MSQVDLVKIATATQAEAARQMAVCNACRYCEGLCAVFPALERRREFAGADVDYLANLCHNCGACYSACQYAPPHEFGIDIPTIMTELREETYARYSWPQPLAGVFKHPGLWVALAALLAIAAFVLASLAALGSSGLFARHTGAGAFYQIIPHNVMEGIFGAVFVAAIGALMISVQRFWRATSSDRATQPSRPVSLAALLPSIWQALKDAASMRYLDGGGRGCMNNSDRPDDKRRLYHHFTAYGFMLCFLATCLGTLFHYAGFEAPYPWWHPVVLSGVIGGIGLIVGPCGLLYARHTRATELRADGRRVMGLAFLWMLLATSASGLALLLWRATPAMGLLLTIHLGVVCALFLSLPYGKFVHGIYRFTALVRNAHEQTHESG